MRYFIELSYKGTHYHGWQVQPNAITVQERLTAAVSRDPGRESDVDGGRQDGYRCSCQLFYSAFRYRETPFRRTWRTG